MTTDLLERPPSDVADEAAPVAPIEAGPGAYAVKFRRPVRKPKAGGGREDEDTTDELEGAPAADNPPGAEEASGYAAKFRRPVRVRKATSEPEDEDDTDELEEAPADGAPDPGADTEPNGYATRLRRRSRKPAPTALGRLKAARRRDRVVNRRRRRFLAILLPILVPGLAATVMLRVMGSGVGPPVKLPPVLAPSAFGGVLVFDSTDRIGTLFHGTLHQAPLPAQADDFALRAESVISVAKEAGYESILIQGPDGTTYVAGPVDSPVFTPLDKKRS